MYVQTHRQINKGILRKDPYPKDPLWVACKIFKTKENNLTEGLSCTDKFVRMVSSLPRNKGVLESRGPIILEEIRYG